MAEDDSIASITDIEEVDKVQENIQNASEKNIIDTQSETRRSHFVSVKAKKRKLDDKESEDSRIDKAFNILQACAQRDNSEVYGEHIAMKLRNYSKRTQSAVQHLFNTILFNADMGQYDKNFNINANFPDVSNNSCFTSTTFTPGTQSTSSYSDMLSSQSTSASLDDSFSVSQNSILSLNEHQHQYHKITLY